MSEDELKSFARNACLTFVLENPPLLYRVVWTACAGKAWETKLESKTGDVWLHVATGPFEGNLCFASVNACDGNLMARFCAEEMVSDRALNDDSCSCSALLLSWMRACVIAFCPLQKGNVVVCQISWETGGGWTLPVWIFDLA